MIEKKHQIKTKPVLMVTNDCPLDIFRINDYLNRKREFDNCTICEYFLGAGECGYQLYETKLIDHTADCESDDGSGALPSTDYRWRFKCAKCGQEFSVFSGFSVMTPGDHGECFDCKTVHRYIEKSHDLFKVDIYFFAIEIDEEGGESEQ